MDSPHVHMIENTLLSTEGINDINISGDVVKCSYDTTLCSPRDIHDVLSRLELSSQLIRSNDVTIDHEFEINL